MPEYDAQARYAYYNKLLFDGQLPTIPITWKVMKNAGGHVAAKFIRSGPPPNPLRVKLGLEDKYSNARLVPGSLHMVLSPLYKRSEIDLDKILIHEMIHVLMNTTGRLGEVHGTQFYLETRRCSKIVGFDIPMVDSIKGFEFAEPVAIKTYGVILIAPKDGSKFVYALVSAKMMHDNIDVLKQRFAYAPKGMNAIVYFYLISDQMWAEKAMKMTVQRKPTKINLFIGTDPKLFADLQQNGKIIVTLTE